MGGKSCCFIGHRETSEEIYPALYAAVEQHILEYGVTEFIVGHYGGFDRLAASAVKEAKRFYPEVKLVLLLPYHPAERPISTPDGFDGTFYPPGMESVPRKAAIIRANRYVVDHVDYLIAYVWHPASNARELAEYAESREKKGSLMRDHGLFQAICRVNRLDGEDKEFGYIIDYKDLFRSLENAVADYTSEAFDCYDKEDVSGLLTDRLDKAKEQLEDSLEALRALCEPVAPPKDMVDYYHYFCGANTEAFDLDELEENMPKREQLYNLSATALRAFGEVSGELHEKYHYTVEQIKALEREVTYYIKVRDDVRLASGDYVDLKKYDPDMRHLIDTYLSADPSRVLTSFGGATLVELLVDNGISALKDMPSSTPKEQEAVAETIENNIGKEIVERTQSNPKYYEKMSALLRELIEKRKNDVINYEEYLRQIVELARKVHKPESGTEYPPEIRESAAKRAFYDHLNGDTVVANQIYNAVMSSKQDNFRGSKIKERKIWRAIRAVVKDDQEADQLLALAKEQSEF